ncbi:B12-binding domain-containing radical SAM protein, partial [Chloroflexota bacterium]
ALETMLRSNPYINIGCYSEGELPFLKILENIYTCSWAEVPSIGFISSNNEFVQTPIANRIDNLNEIPSPYLNGIFDNLIEARPEESWSALWETNRGCPFNCSFCTWGNATDKRIYTYNMKRVLEEVDWFSRHSIEFLFCCDANFGILKERDLQIAEKVVENNKKYGYPRAFSVQSTKNATRTIFELNKILNDAGLQKGVNLALQSVNEETLKSIKRSNISTKVYQELQKMFTDAGIPTFSDMIIGLPNETYDSFVNGVSSVIEEGQHNRIQFINLSILENSEMSVPEYQKKHGMIVQECKMVSHHTTLDDSNAIVEVEHLVVGTKTMPKEDWARLRVFCWMISLLHFNKLLQIPLILLNKSCALSYREMVEIFLVDNKDTPLISEILSLLNDKAMAIQSGNNEYIPSREWLNIWWPLDEFIFIKLCCEGSISQFYEEAGQAIMQYLKGKGLSISPQLIQEAIDLNAQMIKMPFISENTSVSTAYNILEVYEAALVGKDIPLNKGKYGYDIIRNRLVWNSWDEWCREVVWYGTKRGAYLYNYQPTPMKST